MQIQFTTDVVIRETESIPVDLSPDGRTLATLVATIVHDRIEGFCQHYGDDSDSGDSGYIRRIEIVLPEELATGGESRKPGKATASKTRDSSSKGESLLFCHSIHAIVAPAANNSPATGAGKSGGSVRGPITRRKHFPVKTDLTTPKTFPK